MAKPGPKPNTRASTAALLKKLGLKAVNPGVFCGEWIGSGRILKSVSPIDGKVLATVRQAAPAQYEQAVCRASEAFQVWRNVPAPRRGEVIRQLGNALRAAKRDLGLLVTLETGKIPAEGGGGMQEMVDSCDFSTGLSPQPHRLTTAPERPPPPI